jgi:hypothetical protein
VKAFKKDLAMDRLSCHRFLTNQFRLWLHALTYQLIVRLRDYLQGTPGTLWKWRSCFNLSVDSAAARLSARHPWHPLEVETLRRRLFKIGARVKIHPGVLTESQSAVAHGSILALFQRRPTHLMPSPSIRASSPM